MDDTGAQQATPLVHDGVMYLPNPRGVIQALDAATGDLIWEYRPARRRHPRRHGPRRRRADGHSASRAAARRGGGDTGRGIQRNIAIFGDQIFGTTNDAHIVALDARTGKLVWDVDGCRREAGLRVHVRSDRRARQGDRRHDRMQPLQGRRLLHQRPRRGHGQRAVAHVDDRPPGRARRRHVGRSAAAVPRRRRRVDSRAATIPRREPRLLGHGAGQAVGARRARHRWRRALHELDARARSRHRKDEVVLPAHPGETQDMDEVFENILIDVGGRQVAVQDGQAGDSVAARSQDRRIHPRHRSRLPEHPRRRSADRQGDVSARARSRRWASEIDLCPSTAGFKSWRAMAFSPQTQRALSCR